MSQNEPERPWDTLGGAKQATRDRMIEFIKEYFPDPAKKLYALMLPGAECHDAIQLSEALRAHSVAMGGDPTKEPKLVIQAIESNKKIYKKVDETLRSAKVTNETLKQFVGRFKSGAEPTIDIAWLDTTNILTRDQLRMIHTIVENLLSPRAILAVTFVAGHHARKKAYRDVIAYGRDKDTFEEQDKVEANADDFANAIRSFVAKGEDLHDADAYYCYCLSGAEEEKREKLSSLDGKKSTNSHQMPAGKYRPLQSTMIQHSTLHTEIYRSRNKSSDMYFAVFYYDRSTS